MALYTDYLAGAEAYYKSASIPEFLTDPLNRPARYKTGTPAYVVVMSYTLLKAYAEGINTAFELTELMPALNRSFKAEALAMAEFIKNQLTFASSHATLDACFAQILEHLQLSILRILSEKPRKLSGDFSQACLAIYLLLTEMLNEHQKRIIKAKALLTTGKFDELEKQKLDEKTLNRFASSHRRIKSFHEALGTITVDIMDHLIVPMRLIASSIHDPDVVHLRFKRYCLIAQKTPSLYSPRQAIIDILETYNRRFKWINGIPFMTYRTHRSRVACLLSQLKKGEITPQTAIQIMATFPTTPNSEFQHASLGLFCAFMQDGKSSYARVLGQCSVKIGSAETMSMGAFYSKYVLGIHQSERYQAYLKLNALDLVELSRLTEQEKAKIIALKIIDSVELLYLNKFQESSLQSLVSSANHLRDQDPATQLAPRRPRLKNTDYLPGIVTSLIRIAKAEITSNANSLTKQQELICLLCATYDTLSQAGFKELAQPLGNLAIRKEEASSAHQLFEEETKPHFDTLAKLHTYWTDDSSQAMLDNTASDAEAASTAQEEDFDAHVAERLGSPQEFAGGDSPTEAIAASRQKRLSSHEALADDSDTRASYTRYFSRKTTALASTSGPRRHKHAGLFDSHPCLKPALDELNATCQPRRLNRRP